MASGKKSLTTFNDVRDRVEREYPAPIANVFRRYRVAKAEDLGGRHKNLVDLFEVTIKFVGITALQDARLHVPNLRERLPQREKTLEFLKRPSLGGWISLLRILVNLKVDLPEGSWLAKIRAWYQTPKNPEAVETLRMFGVVEGLNFDARSGTPFAEICNAMVTYRNKQIGHGASIHEEVLEERLPVLEHILAALLDSMTFFGEMLPFHTDRIEKADGKGWKVHASALRGTEVEPFTLYASSELDLREIYLVEAGTGEVDRDPPRLGPFLLWRINEERKQEETYFFNDAWRTKLEYLSYVSGDYYYHKELHDDFEQLVKVKLVPGEDEDAYRFMAPEERTARAEELFKRARAFLAENREEDALECLEASAQYERRADTLLEMARTQKRLDDPDQAILQTLQQALELDPSLEGAVKMWKSLSAAGEQAPQAEPEVGEEEAEREQWRVYPTLLHLATPAPLRKWAFPFWAVATAVWYLLSLGSEAVIGSWVHVSINLLQMLIVFVGLLCIAVGRYLFLRMKLRLSIQLDSMRLARFDRWYDRQYESLFGRIHRQGRRWRYDLTDLENRIYLVAGLLLVVGAGALGFLLCELYQFSPFFMVKRWLDNMVLVVLIAMVLIRYIVASTIFIYHFSRLSLKPMLTRLSDDGFRALAPFISANNLFLVAAFLLYLVLGSLEFTYPVRLDFIFLGLGLLFFATWSIGLPVMLRVAAREAKSKSVHAYTEHLEKAFRAFLDDPDEGRDERYQWLLQHQKRIRRMPTWPFTWVETLVSVVLPNLVLVGGIGWYTAVQLGYLASLAVLLR